MAVWWVVNVHLALAADGRSGVKDIKSEVKGAEGGAQGPTQKTEDTWTEKSIKCCLQSEERAKRIEMRGAAHLIEPI